MKIENLIKLPENVICEIRNDLWTIHIDPENENEIYSTYSKQGNLEAREVLDKSGFGIFLEYENGLLWLCPVKKGFRIFENKIAIGHLENGE